ncbi:BTAD domain-containing putative transcriptional regulator [Micromonospora mangrovi]|uniref:BTAD domain-containing putative transcriptional regulator n=2 Tax=Micromonospora TaxID=1873 RepID=A0AAU7MDN4_9ACTN
MVSFRLLGPVTAWDQDQQIDLGRPKQRKVLAALLVSAGVAVSTDTLVDRVWDDRPPAQPRKALHAHVSRLRGLLGRTGGPDGSRPRLVRQSGGYAIDVDPASVDLHHARRLVEQARAPRTDDRDRVSLLRAAVDLWREEPLAGISGRWVEQTRHVLRQQHLDAVVAWARTELRLGNGTDLVTPLTHLTGEYPLTEPLVAALMRALHAAGRSAQAIDVYTTARLRLAEELGTDPGRELQDLHTTILRGDPVTAVARPATVPVGPRPVAPAQLPAAVLGFTGRDSAQAALDGTDARVVAITGAPGIGKTALAVHWAHRTAGRFPDGVLFLDLRGFDPTGNAVDPVEALGTLLAGLGVPATRLPDELAARSALYRTTISDRRLLVVLDNARHAEQVRPLLPAAPGCRTVVTSRDDLTGLVAADGAHPVTLAPLDPTAAESLLAGKIGRDRIDRERDAASGILDHCAGLPLALAIAAARAAITPTWSLTELAGQLFTRDAGLDGFAGRDPRTDLRSVFSWSYLALETLTKRMFRLSALHHGPDLTVPVAASLTGATPDAARRALGELCAARLADEHRPGRYHTHDLLRAYAAELLRVHDPVEERSAAVGRLLAHYLSTAHTATAILDPLRDLPSMPPPAPDVTRVAIGDRKQALSWFRTEHAALAATARQAAILDLPVQAWQLSWHLAGYYEAQGWRSQWRDLQRHALRLTERIGDPAVTAHTHQNLAAACAAQRRHTEADRHFARALDLFIETGDRPGQARVHSGLGVMASHRGQLQRAVEHTERAHRLYTDVGDRVGLARTHNNLAALHTELGQYHDALRHCRLALRLHQGLDDRAGKAYLLDSLGTLLHRLGRYRAAVTYLEAAVQASEENGVMLPLAYALDHLGDAHLALADPARARLHWQRARDLFETFAGQDTGVITTKLDGLDGRPGEPGGVRGSVPSTGAT